MSSYLTCSFTHKAPCCRVDYSQLQWRVLLRPELLSFIDRQVQLDRGDTAAQELVNSLQVLEVMTGAMSAELKPLVNPQR